MLRLAWGWRGRIFRRFSIPSLFNDGGPLSNIGSESFVRRCVHKDESAVEMELESGGDSRSLA
jgi:hypothetical protein